MLSNWRCSELLQSEDIRTRKSTPATLTAAFEAHMKSLDGMNGITIKEYLPGGTLADLHNYGRQTSAATGYLLMQLFDEVRNAATTSTQARGDQFPANCTVYVTWTVDKYKSLSQKFNSSTTSWKTDEYASGSRKRTESGSTWTGYGQEFNLTTTWEFRPQRAERGTPIEQLVFSETVRIEPKAHERYELRKPEPPTAQQYDIGALCDILHNRTSVPHSEVGGGYANLENADHQFPRHNDAVRGIEHSLNELVRLIQDHVDFVSGYMRECVKHNSRVVIPWAIARRVLPAGVAQVGAVKQEPGTATTAMDVEPEMLGADAAKVLHQFHTDQLQAMRPHAGAIGKMSQLLVVLKTCCSHFLECYAAMDHVMCRAFLNAIGTQHAGVFEKCKSLDHMLFKIMIHKASRASIPMEEIVLRLPGCTIWAEAKLADTEYFQRFPAHVHVERDFNGQLCFGAEGSKGVPVHGVYTRYLSNLPTESGGGALAELRLRGKSWFRNEPLVVFLGSPDGRKTNVKNSFLFVDGKCFMYAVTVSSIPSKAEFDESTAVLPNELKEFANSIRACDISNAGVDIHAVPLRSILAHAIGVDEEDLMGDTKFEQQLIRILRAGGSLQSLQQRKKAGEAFEVVDSNGAPDMSELKRAADELEAAVYAKGKADRDRLADQEAKEKEAVEKRKKAEEAERRRQEEERQRLEQQAMGLGSVEAEPCFRSLGAGDVGPGHTPCAAGGDDFGVPEAPATDGEPAADAAIDALADDLDKKMDADDKDFMGKVLENAAKDLSNPKAMLGGILTLDDPEHNCLFADKLHGSGEKHPDAEMPPEKAFKVDENSWAGTDSIIELLRDYGETAKGKRLPTHRFTWFNVFTVWESEHIKSMMAGKHSPSSTLLDVTKNLHKTQMLTK